MGVSDLTWGVDLEWLFTYLTIAYLTNKEILATYKVKAS